MRVLLTYVICIPVAILVGVLLTDPMTYGSLGILLIVLALIAAPILIRWHYPIMVFGLTFPMVCFFLVGSPPFGQVMVLLSLGIAIIGRTLNKEQKFISVPSMTLPLIFLALTVLITAQLTGGIHFHAVSGGGGAGAADTDVGGGRKYVTLLVGIAAYFALASQRIPREQQKLYLMLYMLPGIFGFIGDLFPFLPAPFNYINLLFPPVGLISQEDVQFGTTRLVSLAFAANVVPIYLVARYGLRGVFAEGKLWRPVVLLLFFGLSMLGGFRTVFSAFVFLCVMMFFLERLHRTRLMGIFLILGIMGGACVGAFSDKLPYTIQRSMSFLPLKWRTDVVLDAEASTNWRLNIWQAILPKIPDYLLIGKGYTLTRDDYSMIGHGAFADVYSAHISGDEESLAVSNDFHSGPISTIIGFGIWGAIGMIWLMAATFFVVYRNYQYGPAELKIFNTFMLAFCVKSIVFFFLIYGAFQADVGNFARLAGFSVAMNWGVARRTVRRTIYRPAAALPDAVPQST